MYRFCRLERCSNTLDTVSFLPNAWNSWIESFWASPFGVFLSDPTDSIPAAIAALALIVGTAALVRSVRLTPKPDIHVTVYSLLDSASSATLGGIPEYSLNVSVLNRGAGLALDVVVTVRSRLKKSQTYELGSIATDETKRHQFALRNSDREPAGKVIVTWKHGKRRGARAKY